MVLPRPEARGSLLYRYWYVSAVSNYLVTYSIVSHKSMIKQDSTRKLRYSQTSRPPHRAIGRSSGFLAKGRAHRGAEVGVRDPARILL